MTDSKTCTHGIADGSTDDEPTLQYIVLNVAQWNDCSEIQKDLPIAAFCNQCDAKLSRDQWQRVIEWHGQQTFIDEDIPTQMGNMAEFVKGYLLPDMTATEKQELLAVLQAG